MPEQPAELPGDDGPTADRWNALAVANPTLLVQGPGSECTDLQGLRNFAVNGPDVIAALDEDIAMAAWCGTGTVSILPRPRARR